MGFVTDHATGLLLITNILIGGLGLIVAGFGGHESPIDILKYYPEFCFSQGLNQC